MELSDVRWVARDLSADMWGYTHKPQWYGGAAWLLPDPTPAGGDLRSLEPADLATLGYVRQAHDAANSLQQVNLDAVNIDPDRTYVTPEVFEVANPPNEKTTRPNVPHYQQGSIEPIDYIRAHGMDYLEGNVIKYVTRYKHKNGLADLEKAKDYLNWLIERGEGN